VDPVVDHSGFSAPDHSGAGGHIHIACDRQDGGCGPNLLTFLACVPLFGEELGSLRPSTGGQIWLSRCYSRWVIVLGQVAVHGRLG